MTCSGCGVPIPPNHKYIVVRKGFLGIEMVVGCQHYQPEMKDALAILGGMDCAIQWFDQWLLSLKCHHGTQN